MLTHVQLESGGAASARVVTGAAAVTLGAALATLKGYRKEKASQNIIAGSNTPNAFPWVGNMMDFVQNAGIAPDGSMTAWKVNEQPQTGNFEIYQGQTVVANTAHTASVYLKKGERKRVRLWWVTGAYVDGAVVYFDLSTGTVYSSAVAGAGTLVGYNITPAANDFYLLQVTAILNAAATSGYIVLDILDDAGTATYTGGAGNGVYFWEAKVEVGSIATSRVHTDGVAVTRPEDQLIYPISVVSNAAGTAYAEFEHDGAGPDGAGVIGDASGGTGTLLFLRPSFSGVGLYDGTTAFTSGVAGAVTGAVRGAAVWGGGLSRVFAAGVGGTETAYDGSFGLTTGIVIGSALGVPFQGVIARVEIYDKKLTTTAIQQFPTAAGYALLDNATDPNYAYSANPTLVLAHFINEPGIGPEETPIWSTVAACADINDQVCGAGAQQEFRRRIGLYIDEQQEVSQVEELIRAHAGCWTVREGGLVRFIADAPDSSVFHFTKGTYRLDSLVITQAGRVNSPTVLTVRWTNTAVEPWIEQETDPLKATGVDGGTTPWIESSVPLPGIQQPGQAYREQVRRLNEFLLSDMTVKFVALDQGAKVLKGSVFELSDDEGLTQKAFRCTDVVPLELGRWSITGSEYDAGVHSDSPASAPGLPNTSLPNPASIDAPTAMVITERVYLEKNLSADSLARGLIYQSRGDVTVTPPVHLFKFEYLWETWDGALKIDDAVTASPSYSTPAVQQGKTYTVKAWARNLIGAKSQVALTNTFTAQGKLLPPGDVPAITRALELGGNVILEWTPAVDIDVIRYEWRYYPNGTGSWAAATLIDRVDGLRAFFPGLPVGTHRFYVEAIDSVGNYSANATSVDITVTSDADAFLQDHEFTSPTLTNMISVPAVEGVWKPRWWTNVASDAFNTKITNPVNSTPNALIDAHTSATSKFVGDSWDLGSLVTGDWTLTPNTSNITGVATYAIETSPDGSTWTSQAGTAYSGSARYVRPVIQTLTTGTIAITAPPKISLAAVTQKESGTATSNAVGATTVSLAGKFVKAVSIVVTPKGTTSKTATYDNVVLSLSGANTFDVYFFNAAGTQIASDFIWTFEGF